MAPPWPHALIRTCLGSQGPVGPQKTGKRFFWTQTNARAGRLLQAGPPPFGPGFLLNTLFCSIFSHSVGLLGCPGTIPRRSQLQNWRPRNFRTFPCVFTCSAVASLALFYRLVPPGDRKREKTHDARPGREMALRSVEKARKNAPKTEICLWTPIAERSELHFLVDYPT